MKWLLTPVLLLIQSCILLTGCETGSTGVGEVELYLLESYETVGGGFEISTSSVVVKETPLIPYDDFISYNSDDHIFLITDEAKEAVQSLQHSVRGVAFAVTAGREIVYTGYFWPSYSSLGCNWVVIDPLMIFGDYELRVRLGYPGVVEGSDIPDRRNDRRILGPFRRDGKLVE